VPRARAPIDLALDANEGAPPPESWLAPDVEAARRYPSSRDLELLLASSYGLDPSQVLVTAGADDALDRCCRAVLGPGDEAIFPEPGFAVLRRWISLTGAQVRSVPWPDGAWPLQGVLDVIQPCTKMIVVTSPNNPTGGWVTEAALRTVAAAAPGSLVLVDLAYAEFAEHDLTAAALSLPNAVVTRSFSKAWGLAGMRIGWAAGPAKVIGWLRACGLPYPVSGPSLAAAANAWRHPEHLATTVRRAHQERDTLTAFLRERGVRVQDSQANFVLCRVPDPIGLRDDLAGLGIGVRAFPGVAGLHDALRVGLPGSAPALARLLRAWETVLEPSSFWAEGSAIQVEGIGPSDGPAAGGWAYCTSIHGVRRAQQAGALPLVDNLDLVPAGAAPWGEVSRRTAHLRRRSP
jgi:histidinol-phosphate aminotransferase